MMVRKCGILPILYTGFPVAEQKFKAAKVKLTTLCNYESLVSEALATNYISEEDVATLKEWRQNPAAWGKDFKFLDKHMLRAFHSVKRIKY